MSPEFTRLFLIRHGEVEPTWHGRLYGSLDVPLSERGREQARTVAKRLATSTLDAVYHSGLERAKYGAEQVALDRGLEPIERPSLRELSRGDVAGQRLDELEQHHPGRYAAWLAAPSTERLPGGESLDDLALRVLPELNRIAAEHPGGSVAIVAHGWVLRVALAQPLALHLDRAPTLRVPPASLHAIDHPSDPLNDEPSILCGLDLDHPPAPTRAWYRAPR